MAYSGLCGCVLPLVFSQRHGYTVAVNSSGNVIILDIWIGAEATTIYCSTRSACSCPEVSWFFSLDLFSPTRSNTHATMRRNPFKKQVVFLMRLEKNVYDIIPCSKNTLKRPFVLLSLHYVQCACNYVSFKSYKGRKVMFGIVNCRFFNIHLKLRSQCKSTLLVQWPEIGKKSVCRQIEVASCFLPVSFRNFQKNTT